MFIRVRIQWISRDSDARLLNYIFRNFSEVDRIDLNLTLEIRRHGRHVIDFAFIRREYDKSFVKGNDGARVVKKRSDTIFRVEHRVADHDIAVLLFGSDSIYGHFLRSHTLTIIGDFSENGISELISAIEIAEFTLDTRSKHKAVHADFVWLSVDKHTVGSVGNIKILSRLICRRQRTSKLIFRSGISQTFCIEFSNRRHLDSLRFYRCHIAHIVECRTDMAVLIACREFRNTRFNLRIPYKRHEIGELAVCSLNLATRCVGKFPNRI